MRCRACDCNLSNRESTCKHLVTGEYLDLCDTDLMIIEEIIEIPHSNKTDLSSILCEGEEVD